MCEFCTLTNCKSCPNSEREILCKCDICGEEIYVGEDGFEIPTVGYVCESCIDKARRDFNNEFDNF